MLFRPRHFRRATALLTAVSHLALIGCSSTPVQRAAPVEMNPPAEWDETILRSDGSTAPLDLAQASRRLGGLDGTAPRPPLVPDIRGLHNGRTVCGNNPIAIETLILGATPDSIRGVASLSDPTTPTDTFFVIYEFRGQFDGDSLGLRPVRLLSSSGLPIPGDLVGTTLAEDRIQSRFEGPTAACRPFTLQSTEKVLPDEARRLERNFGEVVASFLPSAPAPPTARERSTPPPPVAAAPSVRKLSPEAADEILKSATADLTRSGNPFFSPPSQAPATSWLPSWMTSENVNKYGGYVAAGTALIIAGVLAYKYGGSPGTGSSSTSSAPDPVPSSEASDRLYQQQEEERERAARQQQGGGSGFYVPPIDPFYDVPN